MNMTLGISAMLLGGWVLPSLEPGGTSDSLPGSYRSAPKAEAPQRSLAPLPPPPPRSTTGPEQTAPSAPGSLYGRGALPRAAEAPREMPLPPTELAGPDGIPMAPTEAAPDVPSGSQPSAFAPTTQQPRRSLRQPQYRPGQVSRVPRRSVGTPGSTAVDKPFSDFRPAPAVSPYLNLFRGDGGLANNYFNLVQPRVRQQQENAQVQHQLRRLEQTSRLQNQAIEDLNRQTEAGRIVTPQFNRRMGGGYAPPFSR